LAELLIIADDLTGALDTGVQLSKQRLSSRVILNPDSIKKFVYSDKLTTVLIVDINSRHSLPDIAAERIKQVFEDIQGSAIKWFYKKTDSTLRGNIGAELEAFIKGTDQITLPFIPAHPKLNRMTRKGFQYIGNTLLHHTSFAEDPLEPVKSSYIPDILKRQTDINVLVSDAEGNPNSSSSGSQNKSIFIFDCQSENDLKGIGKYIFKQGWHKSIAGTAGMVEILPRIYKLETSQVNYQIPKRPMLLVNGSLNKISADQVSYARNKGILSLSLSEFLLDDFNINNNIGNKHLIKQLNDAIIAGLDVIINTSNIDMPDGGQNFTNSDLNKAHFENISKKIGLIITNILNEINFGILCVFGGDTLGGIMNELGCESIKPQSEIIPGVALSLAYSKFGEISLISKPGGYGEKDIILKIINHFKLQSK